MATQNVISANAQKNDGATVLYGGNVDSTNTVTNAPDKSVVGAGPSLDTLPKVAVTGSLATPLSAGVFNSMEAGEYVALKSGDRIAQTTVNLLQKGAAAKDGVDDIHEIQTMRVSFLHSLTWTSDQDGQPSYSFTVNQANSDFNQDHAANPTAAIPGELVYLQGAKTPKQDDYKARTTV